MIPSNYGNKGMSEGGGICSCAPGTFIYKGRHISDRDLDARVVAFSEEPIFHNWWNHSDSAFERVERIRVSKHNQFIVIPTSYGQDTVQSIDRCIYTKIYLISKDVEIRYPDINQVGLDLASIFQGGRHLRGISRREAREIHKINELLEDSPMMSYAFERFVEYGSTIKNVHEMLLMIKERGNTSPSLLLFDGNGEFTGTVVHFGTWFDNLAGYSFANDSTVFSFTESSIVEPNTFALRYDALKPKRSKYI